MITRHTYTRTYSHAGQRIRDQVMSWQLLGFIPLYSRREELWRKADIVTDDLREQVLTADRWQCVYCGSTRADTFSMDHRIPQIQGGTTTFENLLTACRACNAAKNGRTPEEANMPLAYGRYTQIKEDSAGNSILQSASAARVLAQFAAGQDVTMIVKDLYGVTNGRKYTEALAEVNRIIRQLVLERR